jgi:sialic acid synthase SpsE
VVSLDGYSKLFSYCQKKNLQIALSVYDFEGVRFAEGFNAKYIKISSSNITHKPLIQAVCETKSALLLDTGHATTEEIARAINWIEDAGKSHFIVQHSPPAPPAAIQEHNLKYMVNLGTMFGCQYSLSDHHNGNEMLLAAVALGASVVEKGVCLDDAKIDQDVNHAMKISEVGGVLRAIENISAALGSGVRQLHRDRPKYISRMGLVLKHDLVKGHILETRDLDFAFPVVGIPVEHFDLIIGKKLGVDKAAGLPLHWEDLFAGN